MIAQINVRLDRETKQTYHEYCLRSEVKMQSVLLACIDLVLAVAQGGGTAREKTVVADILARARRIRQEAMAL